MLAAIFMKHLYLSLLIIGIVALSCNSDKIDKSKNSSAVGIDNPEIQRLQKKQVDSIFRLNRKNLTILVKIPGKSNLVEVRNENWPEEIETTYNLLKDETGKVILFIESPYSESGDWNITYAHYFDNAGRTFAFTRQTNFFNSICTEGVAYETITEYYNSQFVKQSNEYKLVDTSGHPLNKSKCQFPYDEPYKVLKNRDVCLSKLK